MINYYSILGLKNFNTKNIDKSYNKKLNKFKNLPFYTEKNKNDIYFIKEAYYVLNEPSLKDIFDETLRKISLKEKIKKLSNINKINSRDNENNTIYSRNFDVVTRNENDKINFEKEEKLKKPYINIKPRKIN